MAEKNTKIIVLAPKVSMCPEMGEVTDFLDLCKVKYEGIPEADTGGFELNIIAFIIRHECHEDALDAIEKVRGKEITTKKNGEIIKYNITVELTREKEEEL